MLRFFCGNIRFGGVPWTQKNVFYKMCKWKKIWEKILAEGEGGRRQSLVGKETMHFISILISLTIM